MLFPPALAHPDCDKQNRLPCTPPGPAQTVALPSDMKAQKRNLYLMAAGFLILFYPFPAGMVLYWTLSNILQTVQQQFVRL